MDLLEILVLELLAIDALAAGAIALCKVPTLDHERLYDSMEDRAFVVERLAGIALALLTRA
jgi:hypothetical protein